MIFEGWKGVGLCASPLTPFTSQGLQDHRFLMFAEDLAHDIGDFPQRGIGLDRFENVRHEVFGSPGRFLETGELAGYGLVVPLGL